MPDLITALAIISAIAAIVGIVADIVAMRRTPKPPKPPITPACTTIIGASMDSGISDLPTFDPGMRRMGFDR